MIILTNFAWDSNFGWSDIISVTAAVLTLIAVGISAHASLSAKRSAEISQEANEYIKKQTEYMEKDLLNSHSPKLLPIPLKANFPVSKIDYDFTQEDMFHKPDKLNISIINVSQGNAYMVSSWLEVDSETLNRYFNNLNSTPFYYNRHVSEYLFSSEIDDDSEELNNYKLNVQIYENEEDEPIDVIEGSLEKRYIDTFPIIKQNEESSVHIPNYIYPIILDSLYRKYDEVDFLFDTNEKIINLIIQYKTGSQLESNEYMIRKYAISFTDFDFIESKELKDSKFLFSVVFDFIDENTYKIK